MDRRTFFKIAGAGAGALVAAPMGFAEQYHNTPPTPKSKPPTPEFRPIPGYLYYENTEVAALANCGVEMYQPIDVLTTSTTYTEWYRSGPMEIQIIGDMLPINENHIINLFSHTYDGKMYRIILNMPDNQTYLDAEGHLVSITVESSMDSDEIYGFVFQALGEGTINSLT